MYQIGQTVWVVVKRSKYTAIVDECVVLACGNGKVAYHDDSGLVGVADEGCVFPSKDAAEAHRERITRG